MAHGGFLRQHSDDPELVSHIMHDYTKTNLDPQTRSMLDFATKLTLTPAAMEKSDASKQEPSPPGPPTHRCEARFWEGPVSDGGGGLLGRGPRAVQPECDEAERDLEGCDHDLV